MNKTKAPTTDTLLHNLYIAATRETELEDYVKMDTRELIEKKLSGNNFIEAYVLADQYVDELIKIAFSNVLDDKECSRGNVYIALKFAKSWNSLNIDYCKQRENFKKKRNTLVHQLLKTTTDLKTFPNKEKTKDIIFQYLDLFENLHLELTKLYWQREYSDAGLSRKIQKGVQDQKTEIAAGKLNRCVNIFLQKNTGEISKKFPDYINKKTYEEVVNYAVTEVLRYLSGQRTTI